MSLVRVRAGLARVLSLNCWLATALDHRIGRPAQAMQENAIRGTKLRVIYPAQLESERERVA